MVERKHTGPCHGVRPDGATLGPRVPEILEILTIPEVLEMLRYCRLQMEETLDITRTLGISILPLGPVPRPESPVPLGPVPRSESPVPLGPPPV